MGSLMALQQIDPEAVHGLCSPGQLIQPLAG
jgi:hypothetical protein